MKKQNRASVRETVAKLILVISMPLVCAACVTTAPRYEAAAPECLEYAIAACRAAIVEDGLEAGLIHYFPKWGGGTSHVVVWIKDKNGVERIYDPSHRMYRKIASDAVILHKGTGLDLGIYASLLGSNAGRGTQVAMNTSTDRQGLAGPAGILARD